MQRLNLRTPKPYDYTNESETVTPRAKFYCVSEGPTEESYFFGVKNNKKELGIKNDVFIEIVKKEEGQESFSHPQQLVKACLFNMGRIDEEGNAIPENDWSKNCQWDYDPQLDCVCVIFDRDYRDLESCLPQLYEECKKHNIYIAISNPNFELWLLMHFEEIKKYDRELLLSNPKNLRGQHFPDKSKNKKYLEIVLSIVAQGYHKGCKVNFERYKKSVDLAVLQVQDFCEDSDRLCDELGSSVGRLIKKMRE